MALPLNFWLLFAAAMVISSIGFKNYVWFISIGYGLAIAGEGALMLALYGSQLTAGTILCCVRSYTAAVWAAIWPTGSSRAAPIRRT